MNIGEIYLFLCGFMVVLVASLCVLANAILEDEPKIGFKCPHPYGRCKIMRTSDIQVNGFNVVLDGDDETLCHVLQFRESEE